jgi:hypothetical protein
MGRPPQCDHCCPTTTTTSTSTTSTSTSSTTSTTDCPVDVGVVNCRYEYTDGAWRSVWDVSNEGCLCSCPGPAAAVAFSDGTPPGEGQCFDFVLPCCPPCSPLSIGEFNDTCPTTTTTEDPTTTTTTEEPDPWSVFACAPCEWYDDCPCEDLGQKVNSFKDASCAGEFPDFEQAFQFNNSLGATHITYMFKGACAENNYRIPDMCLPCDDDCCPTTTTTTSTTTSTTPEPCDTLGCWVHCVQNPDTQELVCSAVLNGVMVEGAGCSDLAESRPECSPPSYDGGYPPEITQEMQDKIDECEALGLCHALRIDCCTGEVIATCTPLVCGTTTTTTTPEPTTTTTAIPPTTTTPEPTTLPPPLGACCLGCQEINGVIVNPCVNTLEEDCSGDWSPIRCELFDFCPSCQTTVNPFPDGGEDPDPEGEPEPDPVNPF